MDEVVEIHLPMSHEPADSYFACEEAVTQALESGELGYVDGNDIGQGEFTLFLMGPNGRALLDTVRPLLPTGLLHPGAHAVIRRDNNDEVTEEKVVLAESDRPEPEAADHWAPVSFGAIDSGDSPESDIFRQTLNTIWKSLPTTEPSGPSEVQLVVVWQLPGRVWSEVDEMKVKVEDRAHRMLGTRVPVRKYPNTANECRTQIRESLGRVLEACRSIIKKKRLDWDLTDVEQVINGIAGQ
jgi:hypothetical protein